MRRRRRGKKDEEIGERKHGGERERGERGIRKEEKRRRGRTPDVVEEVEGLDAFVVLLLLCPPELSRVENLADLLENSLANVREVLGLLDRLDLERGVLEGANRSGIGEVSPAIATALKSEGEEGQG